MDLYLQFGHGMMALSEELISLWGEGTVILSPRDLNEDQLERMAGRVSAAGGSALLDPQCYLHDADHERLTTHDYWVTYRGCSTGTLISGSGAKKLLEALGRLDRKLGLARHILPGMLAQQVDDDWFAIHENIVSAAQQEFAPESLIATIAVSSTVGQDEDQIEALVETAGNWSVGGFYLVLETPGQYLVDDPVWVANSLILASGLKITGKTVIVGYSNHQQLGLAAANVDAIAAGTWLNVRAFSTAKFYATSGDDESRRTTWYYCPQALSEYKIPFLDIAARNGVLDQMRPEAATDSGYCVALFSGAQPTSVGWKEGLAFKHFLTSLKAQCAQVSASSYNEACAKQEALLNTAGSTLGTLEANGVFGDYRSFKPIINANRSGLITFDRARGPMMRRTWR